MAIKKRFGISATEIVWDFINTYDIDGKYKLSIRFIHIFTT